MKKPKLANEFAKETDLVSSFLALLQGQRSPFGDVDFGLEFDYRSGRADVVARRDTGEVLAFEAKLRDWRYAAHQAYRNTCFAHRSYIVVPIETAKAAKRFEGEFAKRGVGICSLTEDGLQIILEARRVDPLMPWLCEKAIGHVVRSEDVECSAPRSSRPLRKTGATRTAVNF